MNQQIIALARECLGTPFKHQARVCGRAMDCAGVLVHIFKGLGMEYRDVKDYPRRPYRGMLEKIMADQPHLTEAPKDDLQAGDVVLFRIKTAPQHIGICVGDSLIHSSFDTGKVVEQRMASWLPHVTHVYRIVP